MHHELQVWREAIDLVEEAYRLTSAFPREELYGLASQMRRAAVSVPSNIAEGAARQSEREFLQFLIIARGSLSELETQVLIAEKLGYMKSVEPIMQRINKVFGLVGGLIRALKQRTQNPWTRLTPHASQKRSLSPIYSPNYSI